uniref:Acyltransferase n=1 Tax=Streptomyces sp. NBC_01401 TaxID=2903854 RepID=A0AAU3GQT5_9ACTN
MPASDVRPAVGGRESRLSSLTGLRFIAAFLVLLSHAGGFPLSGSTATGKEAAPYIFDLGNKGVSFFFILSGFVLTWVARPGDTRMRFWRRRLVKVFPNHLVVLAATVALMVYAGIAVTASNTVPSLFLVQTWIPDVNVIQGPGMNTPSWSLACELLFYLAFPWLLLLVRRIRPERLWRWAGIVTLAIIAVPLAAQLLPAEPLMQFDPISWWQYWFVYYFPGTRLLEFVLGMVVARIVLDNRWIRLRLGGALLIAAGAFVAAAFLPGEYGRVAPTALPLALVIAAAATADVQGRSTALSGRVMVWLGEVSYAFYIVHFLVVSYGPIGTAYPEYWGQVWTLPEIVGQVALTFAISLFLAWLLHIFVEEPAMRRWSRPAVDTAPLETTERAHVPPVPVSQDAVRE